MQWRRFENAALNSGRLDDVLSDVLEAFPDSELIYAFDIGGHQMSSNSLQEKVDTSAYWQDLSVRPSTIPLRKLSNTSLRGAFFFNAYVSQITQRQCVTVMYGVRSESSLQRFIAVGFAADAIG